MSDLPAYFTQATLAAHAQISLASLSRYLKNNVGDIKKAEEKIPGLGVRYEGKKCRKFIDLVTAGRAQSGKEAAV